MFCHCDALSEVEANYTRKNGGEYRTQTDHLRVANAALSLMS